MPILSQTVKLLQAGGPGSGCRGDNCGRPAGSGSSDALKSGTGAAFEKMLLSIGKGDLSKQLPSTVKDGIKKLTNAKLHPAFIENRQLTKFQVVASAKSLPHPMAVANYNEKHQFIQVLRQGTSSDDFVHEFGHHVDLAFFRVGGKVGQFRFDEEKREAALQGMLDEYRAARTEVSQTLGHKYSYAKDWEEMARHRFNIPSHYAVDGHKEWFAESFYQYCKGGSYKDRLKSIAPNTYKAIDSLIKGKLFQ